MREIRYTIGDDSSDQLGLIVVGIQKSGRFFLTRNLKMKFMSWYSFFIYFNFSFRPFSLIFFSLINRFIFFCLFCCFNCQVPDSTEQTAETTRLNSYKLEQVS